MKRILACLALSLMAGSLAACPPIVVKKVVAVSPVASVVVTPVYVPIPVLVPTYSAAYLAVPGQTPGSREFGFQAGSPALAPGNAPPAQGLPAQQMPPAAQNGPPDARSGQSSVSLQKLFSNRCAACHQGDATAAASGGGQVLMEDDGSLARFSPAELTMIAFYVAGKTPNGHSCPPRNPLPAEEQQFIATETERLRKDMLQAARQASQRKDFPAQPDRK